MSERKTLLGAAAAGGGAGLLNGLFGGAGGMVLVPGLRHLAGVEDPQLFPTCVAVMLPACAVSVLCSGTSLPVSEAVPWMLGSTAGGIAAAWAGTRVPVLWLHRAFGAVTLAGGVYSLCRWFCSMF